MKLASDVDEAYGCHYKKDALKYLEEFKHLSKVSVTVVRRCLAKLFI